MLTASQGTSSTEPSPEFSSGMTARTPEGNEFTPRMADFLPGHELMDVLLEGVRTAKKSIWLAAAYYDLKTIKQICDALEKNPRAAELEKTLIISAVKGCYRATEEERQANLQGIADLTEKAGFRLMILPILHSKVFLIDQATPATTEETNRMNDWVRASCSANRPDDHPRRVQDFFRRHGIARRTIVGSYNLTNRAAHINIEANTLMVDISMQDRQIILGYEVLALPVSNEGLHKCLLENDRLIREKLQKPDYPGTDDGKQLENQKDLFKIYRESWANLTPEVFSTAWAGIFPEEGLEGSQNGAITTSPAVLEKLSKAIGDQQTSGPEKAGSSHSQEIIYPPSQVAPEPLSLLLLLGKVSMLERKAQEAGHELLSDAYGGMRKTLAGIDNIDTTDDGQQRLHTAAILPANTVEYPFIATLAQMPQQNVLILTPHKQAAKRLMEACQSLKKDRPVAIMNWESDAAQIDAMNPGIVIAHYQGIQMLLESELIRPERFSVVINHGLHNNAMSAEKLALLMNRFSNASLLLYHSAIREILEPVQEVRPSFSITLKEAVEKYGVLCSTKAIVIRSRVESGQAMSAERKDLDKEMLTTLSCDPKRTEMLVKFHGEYIDADTGISFREQKAIVYCYDIKHANAVTSQFNKIFGEGTAAALHSDLTIDGQEKVIEGFKYGKTRVLVNIGMALHLEDPSCAICYNFVPSKSAALIEKQSQIVMQLPRTHEDVSRLEALQQSGRKEAFVVDFYDESTSGQVLFSHVIQGAKLEAPLKGQTKESADAPEGRKPPSKPGVFLDENVEIISEADAVLGLTLKINGERERQEEMQKEYATLRIFIDAMVKHFATDGGSEIDTALVASTTADYFSAIRRAYENSELDPQDDSHLKVRFNGYEGRFPLDAGITARGFHIQSKHEDFAASELGKILQKRRAFLEAAKELPLVLQPLEALPPDKAQEIRGIIEDVVKRLRNKKTARVGEQDFNSSDILVIPIKNQPPENALHIFLSERLALAFHAEIEKSRQSDKQRLLRWNNPGKELSPPARVSEAFPERRPAMPSRWSRDKNKFYMFLAGSEVIVAEDGVIGVARGEGYANNWSINLPATDNDADRITTEKHIHILQGEITKRQQLLSKQLEPELLEVFDKPLALQQLIAQLPHEEAQALQSEQFDQALKIVVERKWLMGTAEDIESRCLKAVENAEGYNERYRAARFLLRAQGYAKQYQQNILFAEAQLIDYLISEAISHELQHTQEAIKDEFKINLLMDTPSGHSLCQIYLEKIQQAEIRNPNHFSSEEEVYLHFKHKVTQEHKEALMQCRKKSMREALGIPCSSHIAPADCEKLEKMMEVTDDLMDPHIAEAFVPHIIVAMRRLQEKEKLFSAIQEHREMLAQNYFNAHPNVVVELVVQSQDILLKIIKNFLARPEDDVYAWFVSQQLKIGLAAASAPASFLQTENFCEPFIQQKVRHGFLARTGDSKEPFLADNNLVVLASAIISDHAHRIAIEGTPSEKMRFNAAFLKMPSEFQKVAKELVINLKMVDDWNEVGISSRNVSLLSKSCDSVPYIVGMVLAAGIRLDISKDVLKQAVVEHCRSNKLYAPEQGIYSDQKHQRDLESKNTATRTGIILAGVYRQLQDGDSIDPQSARMQIYDSYIRAAKEYENEPPPVRYLMDPGAPEKAIQKVVNQTMIRLISQQEEVMHAMVDYCRIIREKAEEDRTQVIADAPNAIKPMVRAHILHILEHGPLDNFVSDNQFWGIPSTNPREIQEVLRYMSPEQNIFILIGDAVKKGISQHLQGASSYHPYADIKDISIEEVGAGKK